MKKALRCSLVVVALALTLVQGTETEPAASTGIGGYCASHYQWCCDFTVRNCSVEEGCFCDQLCHWYGDCCDNITDVCPSDDNSVVVIGNSTATETANSVIIVMADQNKVLRKVVELRTIAAQAVSDLCNNSQCMSYASSTQDYAVETGGYNISITNVSRISPNTSQVVFYVTANNGSVVMAAVVVEALKASTHLMAQFVVYDIRVVTSSPSGDDTNSSSEVLTSTLSPSPSLSPESLTVSSVEKSSPLVLTSSPIVLTSSSQDILTSSPLVFTSSSPLVLSTIQPSVSATEIPASPSPFPSPSQVAPSHSFATGSPTAAPAPDELASQVIGLIVGGAVGVALVTVMILAVVITSCVRRMKAKQDQYREISFTQYPLSEDEVAQVRPKKKGKLVMEYEKLE